ncbi:type IV pilin [Methanofollis formosanus]|uniref:Type IV pilin n=1 Tax=Methanofollis formosanus TaxID=299308 RepID=A0A8G1A088_9EURY|nr:type IV pilin N-terminal domain-containing protein [Methanofollis formosanus]QYZ78665.1 type IV pilin [Methanofollis formosanus]
MNHLVQNEEAISPVIGVILMVAITVILAAVIAAFVLGMAGNISTPKIVAVTATQQGSDEIIITYKGGADHQLIEWLSVTAPNGTIYYTTSKKGTLSASSSGATGPLVGSSMVLMRESSDGDWSGKNHVVVTGHFTDGSEQVVLDTFV